LRHAFRLASGFILVIVGIIGLILPIMPGWIFVIPGLIILSDYFPPLKRFLAWLRTKMPDLEAWQKRSRTASKDESA